MLCCCLAAIAGATPAKRPALKNGEKHEALPYVGRPQA